MYIDRHIARQVAKIIKSKSCFLMGPRQTGKSSLIKNQLVTECLVNLLDSDVYLRLSQRPARLRDETKGHQIVVIDEIQRIPELLNEVHLLIEERGTIFLLTGSSARKLRRSGVNLLGGRARTRHLRPFSWYELADDFDLDKIIANGALPSIVFSDDPNEDLKAYIDDYLRLEIAAEGFVKKLPAFSRFLEVAAMTSGSIINYANIASDAEVPKTTVYEYFEVLRETLIGADLPAFKSTIKRKAISASKFYFFDNGVVRRLRRLDSIPMQSSIYGEFFESWLHHELLCWQDYHNLDDLCYWRSKSGFEVDFVIGGRHAIDVKAKERVSDRDLKGLIALAEEPGIETLTIVSKEEKNRTTHGITIQPWKEFLKHLWQDNSLFLN